MNTDDFINELSHRTPPPAPRRAALALYGLAGLLLGGIAFIAIGGLRPDLDSAWRSTALKMSFGALAVMAMLPIMNRVIVNDLRIARATLGVIAVAVLAAGVSITGMAMTHEPLRWTLWTGGGVPSCLWQIPLIAAPTGTALLFALRRFGPTRLGVAGMTTGVVAGALSAIPYSLFCPVDFAPYVATWYTVAFAACAALGALGGSRFLRW